MASKFIIYQLLLRVFGNTNEKCIPGGSFHINGSGKFSSVTPKVLENLKQLNVTHVWYTGVIEHVTKTTFEQYGIRQDNPAVIKGEAGSPYAIKDYYDVNPYLADSVSSRMQEFEALVSRTHSAGLKAIIDFIPNHLAREYHSDSAPAGTDDFGFRDDASLAFSPKNNFYYIPGKEFDLSRIPNSNNVNNLSGSRFGQYFEYPAKATGNDCFSSTPDVNDWYETVKLNYGVDYLGGGAKYFKPHPKTWNMMRDILLFWAGKGVDGFRCDMAEMVPVEFWHWVIAKVKKEYPNVIFIAEVYNPSLYSSYLEFGGFDYLYDKVGLYDNLKVITQRYEGKAPWFSPASSITGNWQSLGDMQYSMLNFLENHDEQRVASDFNIGNAFRAIPELVVSLMLNTAPFMLYFGQEFGERGMLSEGFSGCDGRTSIFDYCSAPSIVRYLKSLDYLTNAANGDEDLFAVNHLENREFELYSIYRHLFSIAMGEKAIKEGQTYDLEYANNGKIGFDSNDCFVFARMYTGAESNSGNDSFDNSLRELIIIAVDFSQTAKSLPVRLPEHMFSFWNIQPGEYKSQNLLADTSSQLSAKSSGLQNSYSSVQLTPDAPIEVSVNQYGISITKFII